MRILLIDDSALSLNTMQAVLCSSGHEVFASTTPIGATNIILREHIDVVVVDVNLPAIRGDVLAGLFRKQPRLGRVGIVLVSGMPPSDFRQVHISSVADIAVGKADVRARLHNAVVEAFGKRNGAAS
jgi:two-component system OmpR family response regulator